MSLSSFFCYKYQPSKTKLLYRQTTGYSVTKNVAWIAMIAMVDTHRPKYENWRLTPLVKCPTDNLRKALEEKKGSHVKYLSFPLSSEFCWPSKLCSCFILKGKCRCVLTFILIIYITYPRFYLLTILFFRKGSFWGGGGGGGGRTKGETNSNFQTGRWVKKV